MALKELAAGWFGMGGQVPARRCKVILLERVRFFSWFFRPLSRGEQQQQQKED